jgi:hypothetical protein
MIDTAMTFESMPARVSARIRANAAEGCRHACALRPHSYVLRFQKKRYG